MNMSTKIAVALIGSEVLLAGGIALGGPHMTGVAYADDSTDMVVITADGNVYVDAVRRSDLHRPDLLPVCVQEDCSDQPNQVGMWLDRDTGRWFLSVGETSLLVIEE